MTKILYVFSVPDKRNTPEGQQFLLPDCSVSCSTKLCEHCESRTQVLVFGQKLVAKFETLTGGFFLLYLGTWRRMSLVLGRHETGFVDSSEGKMETFE